MISDNNTWHWKPVVPELDWLTRPEAVQCLTTRKKVSKRASRMEDWARRRAAASGPASASLKAAATSSFPAFLSFFLRFAFCLPLPASGKVTHWIRRLDMLATVHSQTEAQRCAVAVANLEGTSSILAGFLQKRSFVFSSWQDLRLAQRPLDAQSSQALEKRRKNQGESACHPNVTCSDNPAQRQQSKQKGSKAAR